MLDAIPAFHALPAGGPARLAACDAFMDAFRARIPADAPPDDDRRKAAWVYAHDRVASGSVLNYDPATQLAFYRDLVEPAAADADDAAVVAWIRARVHAWNATRYGLTNGVVDWHTGGCLAEGTRITLGNGDQKPIEQLRRGDRVWVPTGVGAEAAAVRCVTCMELAPGAALVQLPGATLRLTPWHPVRSAGGDAWVFPADDPAGARRVACGAGARVYNLLLEDPGRHHAVLADGVVALTLGHGLQNDPVASHAFFGDAARVAAALEAIDPEGWASERGAVTLQGSVRDGETGAIVGWV